jgi:hypothetical protein
MQEGADVDPLNSMRDIRFAATLTLIGLYCGLALWKQVSIRQEIARDRTSVVVVSGETLFFLNVFFVASFYVWLLQFGIRRYLIPLEVLSPVVIVALIHQIFPVPWRGIIWITVALVLICFGRPLFHREAPPAGESYFGAKELAAPYNNTRTTFLMTNGWEPASYIIPEFSPDNRFIHLGADFSILPGTRFGKIAQDYIDNAPGRLKMISNTPGMDRITLSRLGLRPTGNCSSGRTVADIFYICDLERAPPSEEAAAAPLHLNEVVDFRDTGGGWVFEQNGPCWSLNEAWRVWATPAGAPWCSLLLFRWDEEQTDDLELNAMVHAFIPSKSSSAKNVTVELNDRIVGTWNFTDSTESVRSLVISKALMHTGTNTLKFRYEHPNSPQEAGSDTNDDRKLSFGLRWLSITHVTANGVGGFNP